MWPRGATGIVGGMLKPNVLRPPTEWRDPRHRQGLAGELAAARYLASRGWKIAAHRFRLGHHDIDLVARRGDLTAFVEVKARRSTSFGSGLEAVGWQKQAIIATVARSWISRYGRAGERYRFDLIVVRWPSGEAFPHVIHVEDAWRVRT